MVNIRNVALSAYRSALADGTSGGFSKTQSLKKIEKPGKSDFAQAVDSEIRRQRMDDPISASRAQEIAAQYMKVEKPLSETVTDSLKKVNDLQTEKNMMIEEFASGRTQNVHELMISLQKAGLAMRMTSAVRNKVMQAYRELAQMQF
ncbi:hook-basal body complex protein FliE [Desulfobaculum bizertense DSM 18034]|uniref:Flagellar hook-basal body complex protein FliE n=2 Tax=Desulfobaculum TaxID=1433996 RepID=A0A1T4WQL4_9BACT|nr:hook-basal body complex protein FliE [Desulfobaculum bizertense DSM 18034]